MKETHEVWYRDAHKVVQNLLSNPDFKGEFDFTPYEEYDESDEANRRYCDFFSGEWVNDQAVSPDS